ncbi:DNA/RNA-binding domain of Phe-tRNA-synthetase-like protein [Parabacteroides sp. PF5-5]|uniref:B3/B4 domain-containing protein n=1 Tax=unclassified Parabacteroides TaxID=2649774 RepID=UPI0024764752|nr:MULTISPECIES: phenylalanine--tRNA ligase beta subunit-related protein [unclassified Parabacteroides]MDH6305317.1 DNA/RNA-binding domain of Phe-tRNA-synthetase-like protein [Parabacteroides sp. PH5-39]MDH6316670.1 DNA/RNA-binding domain of Phe-tRNA-synthetase-like protein [Parabacteroides sp. PF5-13]MDH6320150.1 DNA/RNA-binding domain of Phe-tRNA-synthetase-like protein [Parabacteroides sp. PH5-13]MDH6323907.1 DNA/RNA-binding domain of Phe-tRNA-synthetase-like protein [Parabacteroides sp. PH5
MIQIQISEEIRKACPDLHVLALSCDVKNTPSDPKLWGEIALIEEEIRNTFKLEEVNKWLPIRATRQAYKTLGKDPNRYRPSAEALYRRILRDLPLYKIDTLVDIVNLVSLKSGYSIGAFDVDKIDGESLVLGVGREGELYHGIGRGELNICGLPVYRDKSGGIGTPTSDEERTKIDLQTTRLLMIVNAYSGEDGLQKTGEYAEDLLKKYVTAANLGISLIKC